MSFEALKENIYKTTASNAFKAQRELAQKKLAKLELPHRRIENWKYTNLNKVFENDFSISNQEAHSISPSTDSNFYHAYIHNGELVHCDKELEGMLLKSENSTVREDYFSDDFASILNLSAIDKSISISPTNKTKLERAVYLHYSFSGKGSYHNLNSFISIPKSYELTLLEEVTTTDNCFVNFKSNIELEQNAKLGHTIIQNSKTDSTTFLQPSAVVAKDAYYSNNIINLGSRLSRSNIFIDLQGENAEADAHGLYLLEDEQHHDTMSYIKHSSPLTFSHQLYKGVLDGKSRGVFSGIIRIEKDSQQVNADQLNKNLLLSQKAQANSRPQLEIYADDVKCAHGSTTGQINDEELFYFESRGIDKKRASEILAKAFIFDVVLKIKSKEVRKEVFDILVETKKVSK